MTRARTAALCLGIFVYLFFLTSSHIQASTTLGTIDPHNTGNYKAILLSSGSTINFGLFTTQSAYNVTVSASALRGYIFGSEIGWAVLNCLDTTSGCSATNGNFKVANDGTGLLSGYAWGEQAGWINFGPFSDGSISRVKIDSDGKFGGVLGTAGYAWSENFGWIKFDCSVVGACVETDWREASATTTTTSGGGGPGPTTTSTTDDGTAGDTTGVDPTTTTTGPGTTGTPTTTTTTDGTGGDTGEVATTEEGTGEFTTGEVTTGTEITGTTTVTFPGTSTGIGTSGGETVFTIIGDGITELLEKVATPEAISITKLISSVGAGIALFVSLASVLLLNPFSVSEIVLLPFRLWTLLMSLLGLRRKPWGTVYDSVTKQPLDPVYVTLQDMNGNEIATSITDLDGRYGFLAKAGTYKLIAGKTNYLFPSLKLAGHDHDEVYHDLYFGESVIIKNDGEVIAKNIPMDPLKFDWNEFAKREQKLMKFYTKRDRILLQLSNIAFVAGFIVATVALLAAPKLYNIIIFALYCLIGIVRRSGYRPKSLGGISEKMSGKPIPFAIIRIFSQATQTEITHKVADSRGRYYCLVQNGAYYATIEKKNVDGSYTRIATTEPFEVTNGFMNKSFEV